MTERTDTAGGPPPGRWTECGTVSVYGVPHALKLYAYVGGGDAHAVADRDGMDYLIRFGDCATWFKVADLERIE